MDIVPLGVTEDKHYQTHENIWGGESLLSPWVCNTIKLHFLSIKKTTTIRTNRLPQKWGSKLEITSLNSHFAEI